MDITRIGIDLAKQVFQIHGVDRDGRPVVKKQLRRSQMMAYFSKLPPTLIGMVLVRDEIYPENVGSAR